MYEWLLQHHHCLQAEKRISGPSRLFYNNWLVKTEGLILSISICAQSFLITVYWLTGKTWRAKRWFYRQLSRGPWKQKSSFIPSLCYRRLSVSAVSRFIYWNQVNKWSFWSLCKAIYSHTPERRFFLCFYFHISFFTSSHQYIFGNFCGLYFLWMSHIFHRSEMSLWFLPSELCSIEQPNQYSRKSYQIYYLLR